MDTNDLHLTSGAPTNDIVDTPSAVTADDIVDTPSAVTADDIVDTPSAVTADDIVDTPSAVTADDGTDTSAVVATASPDSGAAQAAVVPQPLGESEDSTMLAIILDSIEREALYWGGESGTRIRNLVGRARQHLQ